MAKAKREGGLYFVGEQAVDANGVAVKNPPKKQKDTDPSEQPGALGAPTPEERAAITLAQALRGELPSQQRRTTKGDDVSDNAADTGNENGDEVEATDAAQKLADENEIDIATVTGSGKDGRVTVEDVKAAIAERDGEE